MKSSKGNYKQPTKFTGQGKSGVAAMKRAAKKRKMRKR